MNKYLKAKQESIKSMGAKELDDFSTEISMSFLEHTDKNDFYKAIDDRRTELKNQIDPVAESSEMKFD